MSEKEYTNKERAAQAKKFISRLRIATPTKERLNCTITSKISDETRKSIEQIAMAECYSLGEATRWLLQLGIEKANELFKREKAARGEPKEDCDF